MLAKWTEVLPLAKRHCERVSISRENVEACAAVARPDVLIKLHHRDLT